MGVLGLDAVATWFGICLFRTGNFGDHNCSLGLLLWAGSLGRLLWTNSLGNFGTCRLRGS